MLGGPHARLWDALTAATEGGKRFRPALVVAAHDVLGGGLPGPAARVGAAVELLHTAFVIHDDVIDGDDTRRGRPNVSGTFAAAASAAGAPHPAPGRDRCRSRRDRAAGRRIRRRHAGGGARDRRCGRPGGHGATAAAGGEPAAARRGAFRGGVPGAPPCHLRQRRDVPAAAPRPRPRVDRARRRSRPDGRLAHLGGGLRRAEQGPRTTPACSPAPARAAAARGGHVRGRGRRAARRGPVVGGGRLDGGGRRHGARLPRPCRSWRCKPLPGPSTQRQLLAPDLRRPRRRARARRRPSRHARQARSSPSRHARQARSSPSRQARPARSSPSRAVSASPVAWSGGSVHGR
ncbi:polyprenyl synthetase family protein [Georgenia sp. SUBG003]|uniref:polyprenyl synthetase family protein n=1 Tax=Georgenia sp. SUBG003 TaxID=1497974 RepID=UPI003AB6B215